MIRLGLFCCCVLYRPQYSAALPLPSHCRRVIPSRQVLPALSFHCRCLKLPLALEGYYSGLSRALYTSAVLFQVESSTSGWLLHGRRLHWQCGCSCSHHHCKSPRQWRQVGKGLHWRGPWSWVNYSTCLSFSWLICQIRITESNSKAWCKAKIIYLPECANCSVNTRYY